MSECTDREWLCYFTKPLAQKQPFGKLWQWECGFWIRSTRLPWALPMLENWKNKKKKGKRADTAEAILSWRLRCSDAPWLWRNGLKDACVPHKDLVSFFLGDSWRPNDYIFLAFDASAQRIQQMLDMDFNESFWSSNACCTDIWMCMPLPSRRAEAWGGPCS